MEKLLLMGKGSDSRYAIEYAKSIGVHTIMTDYLTLEQSPEKKMTDEYWMIDLADLDALEMRCREEKITGVYAGNNEYCLDQTKALAERLGLPFYASDEGWACARDKARFKEHCIECGLDVPKRYRLEKPFNEEILAEIEYPIIVKPVDSCAQQGFSICRNEQELQEAFDKALTFSKSGNILVEEYVQGEEISAQYCLKNGFPYLVVFNQHYTYEVNGRDVMVLGKNQSRLYGEYFAQTDGKLQKLFDSMDCREGTCFLQGIMRNGKFHFLEMGYRLDGVGSWNLSKNFYGVNLIEWLVDLALGRAPQMGWEENQQLSPEGKIGGIYFIWTKPGKVAHVENLEPVRQMDGVEIVLERYKEGDVIEASDNMFQIAYYITIVAETHEGLMDRLKMINDTLHLYDESGNDLLIPFTDYEAVHPN